MKKVLITGGSGFIGSYLIDEFLKANGYQIVNLDIAEPLEKEHNAFWQRVNILNKEKVLNAFENFQPNYVVHLAAYTDTKPENVIEDYTPNTEGTANILHVIKACRSV